ncbi:MAG: glucose-6-phosphate isomerase [Gammaproteobacteria bacterium]
MEPFDTFATQQPAVAWGQNRQDLWQRIRQYAQQRAASPTPTLKSLVEDTARNTALHVHCAGLHIDAARQNVDQTGLQLLYDLLHASSFNTWRDALFNGNPINHTEKRAVLHTALRDSDGRNHTPAPIRHTVKTCFERMSTLAQRIRTGDWTSHTGETITDVVNLGIGGSDLGPRLVVRALEPFCTIQPRVHFVANADPADISLCLDTLNPARTLFIVCSKSFTTQDTLRNAERARSWLLDNLDEPDLSKHFIGVTTNLDAASAFGIAVDNCLPLWDWVGGRYSVWSAIGLSVLIAIGPEHFSDFLRGAADVDHHFQSTDAPQNAPVLLALLSFLNSNVYGAQTHAIVPYATLLEHLPSYLQQLVMESNGKSRLRNGASTSFTTSPIIWGYVGTNSQHSFHQLLHQGTHLIPVDFILPETNAFGSTQDHNTVKAHCLAQMQALLTGRDTVSALAPDANADTTLVAQHRMMSGNRPSTLITFPILDPYHLGSLIALYEHKTFVEACLWDINAYDQWGVELGKALSATLEDQLNTAPTISITDTGMSDTDKPAHDAATQASLDRLRASRS